VNRDVRPAERHGALRPIRRPPTVHALMESRALFEFGAFVAGAPLLAMIGPGDGHPVLVIPGFASTDASTRPLRRALRAHGYWVHGWHHGRNIPSESALADLPAMLSELHERHGARISIVGMSLGGVYARELARTLPGAVRQLITLGSPFRMRPGDRSTLSGLLDRFGPAMPDLPGSDLPEQERPPVPVPVTCVYTRTDGLVRWHTSIEAEGPERENVEVRGSHSGLGTNLSVLVVVLDRLAQRDGGWTPFRRTALRRQLYPAPVWWRPPGDTDR
jgi:pimeloyl-ACP methyl ester carboxylesterase